MNDLAEYIERHTHGIIPVEQCHSIFSTVVSGPESIRQISDDNGLRAAAVLIDTCESEGNAAELTLVCPGGEREILDDLLAWAVGRLKLGKRAQIDVPQWRDGLVPIGWFEARGFRIGYTMYQMEAKSLCPDSGAALPEGWSWREFQKSDTDAFHETLRAAFQTVPGAFVLELPAFRERVLRYPLAPELLFDGDKVAGFVRVEIRENGQGELNILGRHPRYLGMKLGEKLVERGVSKLKGLGATKFHLEVVATNQNAIALYEHFGFQTQKATPVYRRSI